MEVLRHSFRFSGHLSQSCYPDLFLTTADGGGEVIPAHRVVISAVSSKLAVLCKEGGKVMVRNINFKLMEQVIRFIYRGKIELTNSEDVEDLKDGMDMLKVNIVMDSKDSSSEDPKDAASSTYRSKEIVDRNEEHEDVNANIVVKDFWSKSEEVKVENTSIVERSQDIADSIVVATNAGSDEEAGTSFTKILNSFSNDKIKVSKGKKNAVKKMYSKNEIQKREIKCEYCDETLMYKKYMKHCMLNHPESPWNIRKKCGGCNVRIPGVSLKFHLDIFGHAPVDEIEAEMEEEEDVKAERKRTKLADLKAFCEDQRGIHDSIVNKASKNSNVEQSVDQEHAEVGSTDTSEQKKGSYSKGQTKVSCDYCGEKVTLASYVTHCKKLHSVTDSNERCRRKCYRCGAKVHIIAEKFHHEIYHPAKPKHVSGKSEPLQIVEHNKTLTKVPCDYCCERVVFAGYKGHVKSKHPEIAYAEQVKCSKCGSKVAKIAFKFHRQIFHKGFFNKSSKLKPHPISNNPPSLAIKFPPANVSCTVCDAKIKPHNMFWHMKNIHWRDGNSDLDQSPVEGTPRINQKESNSRDRESEMEITREDSADPGQSVAEKETSDHLSSDTSFEELVLRENPLVEPDNSDVL